MKSDFVSMIHPNDVVIALTEYFKKRGIIIRDVELFDSDGDYVKADSIFCTAVSIKIKEVDE